ncbi:hypothetical protein SAMN04488093_101616 [Tropicibacter naphthalenivorans]|uniref:PilZ domain-containing protein n=2 Tax=Tropicibacter naphthalenivorans TaxID=441103 RepID=A0A0P1G068_9RHOB|nr:hypothetical protein TRN7648_00264 [Tropicibacter naphthalenivorans]SMC46653.1 hypothetical protein SAMN04488093_101616 [Tropicibacter naphthalenivorans]
MQVTCAGQECPVKVANVSVSGLKYLGHLPADVGDMVRFTVLGFQITARIARLEDGGGALAFERQLSPVQLSTLRQHRAIPAGY